MPSKSKSQQRFMGMVHALQKGEIKPSKVSDKIKKVAKSIDYDDADDFASTKHKGLPNKVKRESRVKSLIRKMVREVMDEIDEGFAGGLPKGKRKAFDKMRQKQSEVLGYKLTGTNDMKVETDDATVHEGKLTEAHDGKWVVHTASDAYSKPKIMKVAKSKRAATILYNKLIKTDKYEAIGMESVEHWNRTNSPNIKEGKLTEAKETIFDVAAKVMKYSQMYNYKSKTGMVKVDMKTANLLTKTWKKISPKMKKHLAVMGESNPAGLVQTLWAAVK